jgi:hypothetical protein
MNEYQNSVKNDECKNNIYSKKYATNIIHDKKNIHN